MPAEAGGVNTIQILLTRLHECREVAVYEAIERLLQAAGAVGLDARALIAMLDQGKTFEEVFEVIESKLERLQNAA